MRVVESDLLVVGGGPAGSSAAAWASRAGHSVTLIDMATFPRDKACGDGLTPRAIKELTALGLSDWLATRPQNIGLRAAGFGQELLLPWPGGAFPVNGSAAPRVELDNRILQVAKDSGAEIFENTTANDVTLDGDRLVAVIAKQGDEPIEFRAKNFIIADGAHSQLGRKLGREWHRDTAYGVAARGYIASERSDDPWISSHRTSRF